MPDRQQPRESVEQEIGQLQRTEQSILSTERRALHAQDLTNILMVMATVLMAVATGFGAYASWQMARVATDLFLASERPYLGVESIRLDTTDPAEPGSWITFKNVGNIPADRAVIDVSTSIDGSVVPGGLGQKHVVMSLGVLTPQTTYKFSALFPPYFAQRIVDGKSKILVSVKASYGDAAARHYCFEMNFIYYWPLKKYDPAGGSNECRGAEPVYSDETTLSHQMDADRH